MRPLFTYPHSYHRVPVVFTEPLVGQPLVRGIFASRAVTDVSETYCRMCDTPAGVQEIARLDMRICRIIQPGIRPVAVYERT